MTAIDIISGLSALLIGLLLGIQREYHGYHTDKKVFSGARTFTIVSIYGFAVVRFFGDEIDQIIFLTSLFILIFLSIPVLKHKMSTPGMTTSVALVLALLLGMLVGYSMIFESLAISLILFVILTFKERLHRFASVLTKKDLASAIRFIAVSIVILPLTYNVGTIHPLVGPGQLFDTVKTVLMIIFVSSMSFTSYLVIKFIGAEKGIEVSTFLGGFVNSAASTASISQKSKKNPGLLPISMISVLLTNTSMMIKDIILMVVLAGGGIIMVLVPPVGLLIIISLVLVFVFRKEGSPSSSIDLELGTPFAITPAIKFALIFSMISASAYLLKTYLGSYGVYAVAAGGIVSTTSVSASLALLYSGGEISAITATITLVLALGLGSLSKITIMRVYDKQLMKDTSVPLIIVASAAISLSLILLITGK